MEEGECKNKTNSHSGLQQTHNGIKYVELILVSVFMIEIWGVITRERYHSNYKLLKCGCHSGSLVIAVCQPDCYFRNLLSDSSSASRIGQFFHLILSVCVCLFCRILLIKLHTSLWKDRSSVTKTHITST